MFDARARSPTHPLHLVRTHNARQATHGAQSVTLATRSGFVSVPASFSESLKYPPLDCIIMNFATHAWETDWARRVGLHWFITTKISRLGFLLSTGSSWGFNQWGGFRYNMTWDQGRKHIVNKSPKCMALINRRLKRRRSSVMRRRINSSGNLATNPQPYCKVSSCNLSLGVMTEVQRLCHPHAAQDG